MNYAILKTNTTIIGNFKFPTLGFISLNLKLTLYRKMKGSWVAKANGSSGVESPV